ncbi:MAG: hypothetical protein ACM3TR_02890 [Caulobacteraceae bacterium]
MNLSVKENISLEDMAHDDLVFATMSKEEVKRLDYSTIAQYINELENSKDDPRHKLVLSFKEYEEASGKIYEVSDIRRWMTGLVDKYPYIFYLLNPNYGISTVLMAACIGDVQAVDEETDLDRIKYISSGYELTNLKQGWFKIKLSSEISNKILESLIEYGTKVGWDPDNILLTILGIPGLNGG